MDQELVPAANLLAVACEIKLSLGTSEVVVEVTQHLLFDGTIFRRKKLLKLTLSIRKRNGSYLASFTVE